METLQLTSIIFTSILLLELFITHMKREHTALEHIGFILTLAFFSYLIAFLITTTL